MLEIPDEIKGDVIRQLNEEYVEALTDPEKCEALFNSIQKKLNTVKNDVRYLVCE